MKKFKALKFLLTHKPLKKLMKEAGFIDKTDKRYTCMSEMVCNTKIFVYVTTSTIKSRGRTDDYNRSAIEILQSVMISTPENDPNMPTRS